MAVMKDVQKDLMIHDLDMEIEKLKCRNMYLENQVATGCNGCDKEKETTGLRDVIEKLKKELEVAKDVTALQHQRICRFLGKPLEEQDSRLKLLEGYFKAWTMTMEIMPWVKKAYERILKALNDGEVA